MLRATIFPALFLVVAWAVFLVDFNSEVHFYKLGVYTRSLKGLLGIFTYPLVHNASSFNHIFSNSVPILVLGSMLFYFYREIAFKVFFGIWLMSGAWLWVLSRPSFHIGASGIVYGLAFFLFFSGWIRRSKPLMGLSLLVAFLYGSIIWGILPIDWQISFEGHFYGALAGLLLAYIYRKKGPQRKAYVWEEEDEEDNEHEDEHTPTGTVNYEYIENKPKDKKA